MKAPIAGLVVSTVAFAGSSVYLWVRLGEERALVNDLGRRLDERVAELERERSDPGRQRLATAPGAFARSSTPTVNPPDTNTVTDSNTGGATGFVNEPDDLHFNSPERSAGYQKMMRAHYRANNRRNLAELGELLKLHDDEEKKLLDLLTDQQMDSMTRAVEASKSGDPQEHWQDIQREHQEQIVNLIGPEKAEELRKYQESLPARSEVELIASQLEGSDVPLKDEQRKRLVAVVSEERIRVPMPVFNVGGDQQSYAQAANDWQEDYEQRLNAQARNIMNSEQYNAYSEYQQWQREMRQQFHINRVTETGSSDTMFVIGTNVATPAILAPAPDPPKKK